MGTANDVITDALRRPGTIAPGETPSASEAAQALARLNAMCVDMFDGWTPLTDKRLTASVRLRDEDYNFVATGVAATITLPADPREGQRVGVYDGAGTLATYPVTLNANGKRIENAASVTVSTNGLSRQWFYRADKGWTRIADVAVGDEPIFPFHDGLGAMLAIELAESYGTPVGPVLARAAEKARARLNLRFNRRKPVACDEAVLLLSVPTRPTGLDFQE